MPSTATSLSVIDPRGDWFLGRRLPEYRLNWRDPNRHFHPLEIVGRHLHCRIHGDPIVAPMTGMLGLAPQSWCSQLEVAWPTFFTANSGFHSMYLNRLMIADTFVNTPKLQFAHSQIMATMVEALAQAIAPISPLSRDASGDRTILAACEILQKEPKVGSSHKLDRRQLEFMVSKTNPAKWRIGKTYYAMGYRLPTFKKHLRQLRISSTWWQKLPVTPLEASEPFSLNI